MTRKAFQDFYPDHLSYCYGCGRLNERGLQIKTYWETDDTTLTVFRPRPEHMAIPGFVYGGLIASLVDCHCTGTASAAAIRAAGLTPQTAASEPRFRFVTAALQVNYLRPTPLGLPLEIRGQVKELKERKVVVSATLVANGEVCARGEVVTVQMPETFLTAS
jgi:acyl-coenzyme A thioesterase PaaI-like protein